MANRLPLASTPCETQSSSTSPQEAHGLSNNTTTNTFNLDFHCFACLPFELPANPKQERYRGSRPHYNNSQRIASKKIRHRMYAENGQDPTRVASLLQSGCCKQKCCASIQFATLMKFLDLFYEKAKRTQDEIAWPLFSVRCVLCSLCFFVVCCHTCKTKLRLAALPSHVGPTHTSYVCLGQAVKARCMAKLLAIHIHRIRKAARGFNSNLSDHCLKTNNHVIGKIF